jgi:hypothetical protein
MRSIWTLKFYVTIRSTVSTIINIILTMRIKCKRSYWPHCHNNVDDGRNCRPHSDIKCKRSYWPHCHNNVDDGRNCRPHSDIKCKRSYWPHCHNNIDDGRNCRPLYHHQHYCDNEVNRISYILYHYEVYSFYHHQHYCDNEVNRIRPRTFYVTMRSINSTIINFIVTMRSIGSDLLPLLWQWGQ